MFCIFVVSKWPSGMEALTKFTFRATADDELSFEKGSVVKVRRYKIFKRKYSGCYIFWWLSLFVDIFLSLTHRFWIWTAIKIGTKPNRMEKSVIFLLTISKCTLTSKEKDWKFIINNIKDQEIATIEYI